MNEWSIWAAAFWFCWTGPPCRSGEGGRVWDSAECDQTTNWTGRAATATAIMRPRMLRGSEFYWTVTFSLLTPSMYTEDILSLQESPEIPLFLIKTLRPTDPKTLLSRRPIRCGGARLRTISQPATQCKVWASRGTMPIVETRRTWN